MHKIKIIDISAAENKNRPWYNVTKSNMAEQVYVCISLVRIVSHSLVFIR